MLTGAESDPGERLQKVLARSGLGSRRACEELIAANRVRVNGVTVSLGARVTPTDVITVDDVPVVTDASLVYYLLHKPSGVVTTADDPQGRKTVIELVPNEPRVFPVGRLDFETTGLLILTNDGELTQLLTHPSHGVVKTYVAEVVGDPDASELRTLRTGVELDDGRTAPAAVRVVGRHGGHALVEIAIHEGRNRQVRRMCEAVGFPVVHLVRTRIGPLHDSRLAPGSWRPLSVSEVRKLYAAGLGNPKPNERNR